MWHSSSSSPLPDSSSTSSSSSSEALSAAPLPLLLRLPETHPFPLAELVPTAPSPPPLIIPTSTPVPVPAAVPAISVAGPSSSSSSSSSRPPSSGSQSSSSAGSSGSSHEQRRQLKAAEREKHSRKELQRRRGMKEKFTRLSTLLETGRKDRLAVLARAIERLEEQETLLALCRAREAQLDAWIRRRRTQFYTAPEAFEEPPPLIEPFLTASVAVASAAPTHPTPVRYAAVAAAAVDAAAQQPLAGLAMDQDDDVGPALQVGRLPPMMPQDMELLGMPSMHRSSRGSVGSQEKDDSP